MFSPVRRLVTLLVLLTVAALGVGAPVSAQWLENGNDIVLSNQVPTYHKTCSDGEGGVILSRVDGARVYVHRVDAHGRSLWAPGGIDVTNDPYYHGNAELVADGSGGAIIAFTRASAWDPADIWIQRIDADGNLLWGATGDSLCSATGMQSNVFLTTDGAGGAIVAWQDARGGDFDIYVQHIDTNGAAQWTADGVAICTAANTQEIPRVVSDLNGGALIGWRDARVGGGVYDLYASRITSNGTIYGDANGELICDVAGSYYGYDIVSDGAGGAILTWSDNRSGRFIYAQRVNWAAGPQWTTNGIPLTSTAPSGQMTPVMVSDDAGGAIVVWGDYRSGSSVYAQRIDGSGNPLWSIDGVALCTWANVDEIAVTTDAAGGAIATWDDNRTLVEDIYAQRVDTNGAVSWTANGVPLCTAFGPQAAPAIAPDGEGGAIVIWLDYASRYLQAQRAERNGYWGYPSGVIFSCRDVPGDQGGLVNLAWHASRLDPWPDMQIAYYTLWRAIESDPGAPGVLPLGAGVSLTVDAAARPGLPAGARLVEPQDVTRDLEGPVYRYEPRGSTVYFWELVATQDAYHLSSYAKTIPTLFDSTDISPGPHYFQVMAHGTDPGEFWISPPDSGRSVDNLAPAAPQGLAGSLMLNPAGIDLLWFANTEADLSHYAVYRGLTPDFVADAGSLVASTGDTTTFDPGGVGDLFYYKVFAVDVHGNESPFALLSPTTITAVGDDRRQGVTRLAQNVPNPCAALGTRIAFSLREPGEVSLRVFDASGRLVRVLAEGLHAAGPHEAAWDGRDARGRTAASGVYYYRLEAPAFSQTRRMVLLRQTR